MQKFCIRDQDLNGRDRMDMRMLKKRRAIVNSVHLNPASNERDSPLN